MRSLLALAVIAAAAAPAAAQMPDPRQMSGIPRPDQKIDGGTITVKLTAGELGRFAPEGTPVHLVVFDASGIRKITRPVDDEGRAYFENLARGARAAYYAFASWNGDRLVSQSIELPPEVGVALMLTGRKVDPATGQPVGDPIDDGHDGDLPRAPAGAVDVYVGGEIAPGATIAVHRVGADGTAQVAEGRLEKQGDRLLARITGLEPGSEHVYIAELERGGQKWRTRPFMMAEGAGASTWIIAAKPMLFGMQGGAQLDDEKMWFQISFAIANVTGSPIFFGKEGLLIPLPDGFTGGSVGEEDAMRAEIVPDEGVRWKGMIPPGQHELVVQFALPVDDGHMTFALDTPHGFDQGQLALDKGPGVEVSGVTARARELDGGQSFWVLSDLTAPPGGKIRFEVSGLPRRPMYMKVGSWLVGVIVLGLIGWALAIAIRGSGAASRAAAGADAVRRRELAVQRDRLYEELVALERRRAAGNIDDDEYQRERKNLVARLVVVHRDLDAVDAGKNDKGKHTRA